MANAQPLFGSTQSMGSKREKPLPDADPRRPSQLSPVPPDKPGDNPETTMFSSLEDAAEGRHAGSMASGFVLQAALVAGIVVYAMVAPRFIPTQVGHIDLVAPSPDLAPPRSTPTQPLKAAPVVPPATKLTLSPETVATLRLPQRIKPVAQPEVAQPSALPAPKFDAKVLNEIPGPKTVRTVASTGFGSSAAPTLDKVAPSRVQTGGFGDPNGVPLNANGHGKANIAAVGGFDMPRGAGYGNGTGGASGARGTVASAGFGNGTAVTGNGGRGGQGRVQSVPGFTQPVATSEPKHAAAHAPSSAPVSILSKPHPIYTAEARAHRVEGEVLLNVIFTSDGKVKVQGVVRGLGYGLDEAAVRAVQGMKFNPATRDGHAVDSNAVLHVVFQLS